MLLVHCVKWGTKYSPEYVYKLQAACLRCLPPHKFVCHTDDPIENVECVELTSDLPGWWAKLELFKPGDDASKHLYFDLDVVITEDLTPFLLAADADPDKLWSLDDFDYPLMNPKRGMDSRTRGLLGGDGTINSSVMVWRGNVASAVWGGFTPDVMLTLHGDQNWITQTLWPDKISLFPPGFATSYKRGKGQRAPVVVFHGDPKPHQVMNTWVERFWTLL